jgi:hypothetical protein
MPGFASTSRITGTIVRYMLAAKGGELQKH